MGKLTVKQAEELVKKGVLDKDTLVSMRTEGLVSSRRNSTRRFMKTADNTYVSPQLYFAGLKGAKYSNKMKELRDKFNNLVDGYTTVRTNSK
jgi:hypothetical protein|tara:strand:+ start:182 stop:457 length:276 start_codon:yes stop_codon:yes gene_type:complete